MKKQYVSLLVILITAGTFFSSCDDKKKPTGALEFDNIRLTESEHLFGDTAKPGSQLIINYVYVTKSDDEVLKEILNNYFIANCLDETYTDTDPHEAIKKYADLYTSEYRMDLEPMFLEDQKNNNREDEAVSFASWYDYYQNIESNVQLYEGDLLVYKIQFNEFTGGAHGMERTSFLNIDLKEKRELLLEDIFIEDSSDALIQLLWQQLMTDNKVSTREDLELMGYGLTGDLIPSENFYLDRKGVAFYYNVYEIAPYSMGPVEIRLSYDMVNNLLKESNIITSLRKLS